MCWCLKTCQNQLWNRAVSCEILESLLSNDFFTFTGKLNHMTFKKNLHNSDDLQMGLSCNMLRDVISLCYYSKAHLAQGFYILAGNCNAVHCMLLSYSSCYCSRLPVWRLVLVNKQMPLFLPYWQTKSLRPPNCWAAHPLLALTDYKPKILNA